jgi:prepilin-type N-terminal cleavage/methylation domain-containing protein
MNNRAFTLTQIANVLASAENSHDAVTSSRVKALACGKQNRGFTLTEVAIVLAIIGLILAAIWGAYNKVSENYRIERAMTQIMTIYNNYEKLNLTALAAGLPVNGQTDLTCQGLVSGYFPADMVKFPVSSCINDDGSSYPQGPWYEMYPKEFWTGLDPVFIQMTNFAGEPPLLIIMYTGISNEACAAITLAAYNWPHLYEVFAYSLGEAIGTAYLGADYGGSPPDPGAVGEGCAGPQGDATVLIYYAIQ